MSQTTIDANEVAKFHALAETWWDLEGPFKTLHRLNPVRVGMIQSFGDVKEKTILDVGCGGGILSESLASLGAMVTGIDADPRSIEIAKKHASHSSLVLTYHTTPVETFPHSPFDMVTCFEMLEHVAAPETVIKACAAKLAPGGYLFLSTINRTMQAYLSAVIMAEYVLNLLPRQTHDYAKFIRPSELAAMARKAGLAVVKLLGVGYLPVVHQAFLQRSVQVNYIMVCQKTLRD